MPGHYAPVPRLCERLLPCCQTCHPISLSLCVPRSQESQHSITGGSNTVSPTLTPLSLFLTLSLTHCHFMHVGASLVPPLNFTSACCLLTTVALSPAGFEAVGLQTLRRPSVRPSIGEIVASLSLFQRKDWRRRRRKTERGGGMEGKERAVRASRAHSFGTVSRHYILSLLCTSAIMIIQHRHQVDIRPCPKS